MAILQAARAERLGLPEPSAYSFGLNRAIFFAAAKRGFQEGSGTPGEVGPPRSEGTREPYRVGEEFAYRDTTRPTVYFTIGGSTQTEQEFERQIVARFGRRENFDRAWAEATEIVAAADDASVKSGRGFYDRVYRPRRDLLRAKWTAMIGGRAEG
jgi:hypothetical protein